MSVHDAQPGDVYADANGKLWRVFAVIGEPSVEMEEIEKSGEYPDRVTRSGGVSGYMWNGYKRIFRREP